MNIPRAEHPRTQMRRDKWINLNGVWQFEIDYGDSGRAQGILERELKRRITVPFCPESELSGIGERDFMPSVWYRCAFTLPDDWQGQRVLLHFGAVDYLCEAFLNGQSAGTHRGGYSSFEFELTSLLKPGENILVVNARDDLRSGRQPGGKQSSKYASYGCFYTRTTGIWQTVWLECLPDTALREVAYEPDVDNGRVYVRALLDGDTDGVDMRVETFYEGRPTGAVTVKASSVARACVKLDVLKLWELGKGRLYDTRITLLRGDQKLDCVDGYFGMRKLELKRDGLYINDKPVFMRLVLDQGFYPDGIYTAPGDAALLGDIQLAMAMGFNGARLHEKVFEPRFLYWADRMGYMVWGEFPNWGVDISNPGILAAYQDEWLEAVRRDMSHPAVVGWCPFNETWDYDGRRQCDDTLRSIYLMTKALDPTRPVIDTSGNYHVITDIYDVHDYEQRADVFAQHYAPMADGGEVYESHKGRQSYGGQPYFVSEYGGIWAPADGEWQRDDGASWGYGQRPGSEEEFIARYDALTTALLNNPHICGFCYTQLYDVEQEQNGLYTYARKPKFDAGIIRGINARRAAMERQ